MATILSKLFIYLLLAAAVIFVVSLLAGCLNEGDMSRREAIEVVGVYKELRK